MQNEWMHALSKEVKTVFIGECRPVMASKAGFLVHTPMYCPNWWLDSLWQNGSTTFDIINQQFENVASAVTNHIRTVGLVYQANESFGAILTDADLAFVTGTTEQNSLCIQFDWMWLLLPTSLTFITLALLIASVLRTYLRSGATPAWKSSVLPLLFHGFRDRVVPPNHNMHPQEIEQTTKAMTARFAPDEHGGSGIVLEGEGALRRRYPGGSDGYEFVEHR
jgi:hypothetical protein